MTGSSSPWSGPLIGALIVLGIGLGGSAIATAGTESGAEADRAAVEAAVRSFNAAVTARDPDAVASHFADGAVLLNDKPAHAGVGGGAELASDAVVQWKAVASLLQAGTRSYSRTVDELQVQVEGDLATVWCTTHTETRPLEGSGVTVMDFSETYILFRRHGGWKIAALANNRPTR